MTWLNLKSVGGQELRLTRLCFALAAGIFLVSVLRQAWVTDDAFITLRAAENALQGRGLTYNPGTRVQVYTSPLGMLGDLAALALSHEPYHAALISSLLPCLALVWVLGSQEAVSKPVAALVLLALSLSRSFLDFSTSGLENSLLHFFLASAYFLSQSLRPTAEPTSAECGSHRSWPLWACCAGVCLTRLDASLLCLPLLLAMAWRNRRNLRSSWAFLLPVCLWFGFSLSYYGFLFPNTAYAKLNAVIPGRILCEQGLAYLLDAALQDPWLALSLPLGLLLFWHGGEQSLWAAGLALYLAYVLRIGGDFMSGRFLTAPLLLSLLLLSTTLRRVPNQALGVAGGLLLLCLQSGWGDRRAHRTRTDCIVPATGIVNERECYVEHTGLAENLRLRRWRQHGYLQTFRDLVARSPGRVVQSDLVGMSSFAGRSVEDELWRLPAGKYVLESYALTDPFLARLRVSWKQLNYRPGHLRRPIPPAYLQSLESGKNELQDPCQRQLYADLQLVMQQSLWRGERWKAIWRLNTGHGSCSI